MYRDEAGCLSVAIAAPAPPPRRVDIQLLRALAIAGWTPRLRVCVVCGEPISSTLSWYFSIPAGGLMCAADHTPESEAVSWDAICRLSALVDGDWGELDGVPAAASIQRETHQIVEEWGEYYLERPIRSMRLLD